MTKKHLTDKQEAFIELYFREVESGNSKNAASIAKDEAGYSESTRPHEVLKSVKDEILERANVIAATTVPEALFKVQEVMRKPEPGASLMLKAAEGILDRGGLPKRQAVEVESDTPNQIIILPPKEGDDGEDSGSDGS